MDRVLTVPELKPLSPKPFDLKMNNQPMKCCLKPSPR